MNRPPKLTTWLLRLRLPSAWGEFVIGDLHEEFAMRSAKSPVAAHGWLWWQTLRCLAAPPRVHTTPASLETSGGDSAMRTFAADLRHSLRAMLRAPAFAV